MSVLTKLARANWWTDPTTLSGPILCPPPQYLHPRPTNHFMSSQGKGKRPYKVWDSGRQVRKGLVVASFNELIEKGEKDKFFSFLYVQSPV